MNQILSVIRHKVVFTFFKILYVSRIARFSTHKRRFRNFDIIIWVIRKFKVSIVAINANKKMEEFRRRHFQPVASRSDVLHRLATNETHFHTRNSYTYVQKMFLLILV